MVVAVSLDQVNANRTSGAALARKPAGAFFRWQAPGEPLAVYFHLNVVELLESDAIRGGKGGTAGVLLGRIETGRHPTLIVEDCEPNPTSARRGPAGSPFEDRQGWESLVERWQSGPQKRISALGFYRTCVQGEAILSAQDLAILSANPNVSEQLFLLIEPHVERPSKAVLFMTRAGAVAWQWDALFFNRKELTGGGWAPQSANSRVQDSPPQQKGAVSESQEPRPRPQKSPEASSKLRWQLGSLAGAAVVVAATIPLLVGRSSRAPSKGLEAGSESALGLQVQRKGNDLQVSWSPVAPILAKASGAHLSIVDGGIPKMVNLDLNDLLRGSISYSPMTDDVVLRLDVVGAQSPAMDSESVRIVAGLPPALPDRLEAPPAHSAPAISSVFAPAPIAEGASYGIDAVRSALTNSRPAEMTGPSTRNLPPTPNVTREAPSLDSSAASNVDAVSRRNGFTAPISSPSASGPTPSAKSSSYRINGVKPTAANSRSVEMANLATSDLSSIPSTPRAAIPHESSGATNDTASWEDSFKVLPLSGASPEFDSKGSASGLGFAASAPPVRGPEQDEKFEAAQPIVIKDPVYPQTARDSGVSGTVEVNYRVGVDGEVRDVSVVNGPSLLVPAALQALRAWRYRPATLNNSPVESEVRITFVFKLN